MHTAQAAAASTHLRIGARGIFSRGGQMMSRREGPRRDGVLGEEGLYAAPPAIEGLGSAHRFLYNF